MYDWFRAIHIIAVIAWMAGMLIYPPPAGLPARRRPEIPASRPAMDKAANSTRTIILIPTTGADLADGALHALRRQLELLHRPGLVHARPRPCWWSACRASTAYLVGLGGKDHRRAKKQLLEPKKRPFARSTGIPMVVAILAVGIMVGSAAFFSADRG